MALSFNMKRVFSFCRPVLSTHLKECQVISSNLTYRQTLCIQFIVLKCVLDFPPISSSLTFIFFFLWRCDPTRVMASSFLRFLDHTQRRTIVGRTPMDEWSAPRRDLYLTTHNTHNKHPCPRWDSNPRSQQVSGRRPTPQTARPLGPPIFLDLNVLNTIWGGIKIIKFPFKQFSPSSSSVLCRMSKHSPEHPALRPPKSALITGTRGQVSFPHKTETNLFEHIGLWVGNGKTRTLKWIAAGIISTSLNICSMNWGSY